MRYRYRLQRKEAYVMPNILGNKSYPVHTYRWVDIVMSNDIESLIESFGGLLFPNEYRVIDTEDGDKVVKMVRR